MTIRVRARHVVFSAPDSTRTRTVVEIFELSNDSSVPRVARGDSGVVWESVLLEGARDARIGQADFSPEAVRFADGRARLFAPFAPGLKQLSFSYTVPAADDDFSLLVASTADVVEVLPDLDSAHLTATLAARNLHVWTDYSGVDPEAYFGSNTDGTSEFQSFGPKRYYTLRLTLGL